LKKWKKKFMKKHQVKRISKFLGLSWIILMGIAVVNPTIAQQVRGTVAEKIVGKVDNYIILKSDLESNYLRGLREGMFKAADGRCAALESLILGKVLVAKAEIDSIEVSDAEVYMELDNRLNMMIQRLGGEAAIEAQYGKSMSQIRLDLFRDVKEQELAEAMEREIFEDVTVTPSEVRKYFNSIPRNERPYYSAEVKLGVIEKKPVAGKAQKDEIKSKLTEIRRKIVEGEATFAQMAAEHGMDATSQRGGDLGFYKRGELDPTFEAIAMKMKVGDISQVFESQFGFHILQLIERRGNEYNTRHIVIMPQPSIEDKNKAKQYLDSLKTEIEAGNISFEKAASEYSDDKNTSSGGGFMMGRYGGYTISVEDISPELYLTIDTMKVGTYSRPVTFRQEDGTETYQILYYHSRISPHEANLDQDYEKLKSVALALKKDKVRKEWFQRAMTEVFVDVAPEYRNCAFLENQQ